MRLNPPVLKFMRHGHQDGPARTPVTPAVAAAELRAVRAVGSVTVAAGLLVLAGWQWDISALKTLLPGLVAMKANAAACFVLLGAALWCAVKPERMLLARGLAAIIGAVGLVTCLEYAFRWNPGFDHWLFTDTMVLPVAAVPGRMALMTAIDFVLLACAVWLLDVEVRGWRPANWLALVVGANAFLAVLGYVYGVSALYRVVTVSAMALHTAILFLVCSLALALSRPASLFVTQLLGRDASGLVLRRLLPAALVTPPLIASMALLGERYGLYDSLFRAALIAICNVAVFTLLVWSSAVAIRRLALKTQSLTETSAWQQAILNSADFTVISTEVDGTIRTLNQGVADKLGYAPEELLGRHTPAIIHDPDEVVARAQALTVELGHPVEPGFETFVAKAKLGLVDQNDWTYIKKDGSRFPVRLTVTAITAEDGRLTGFLGVGYDITLQKRAEDKLRRMAQFDELTGLPNRNRFDEGLLEAVAGSDRDGTPMALMFMDLDCFKEINDSLGHQAGDMVLQEFAQRIGHAIRPSDLLARLSGDEFVIILGKLAHPHDVHGVAQKILDAMRPPFHLGDVQKPVSVSIGIAVRQPGETSGTDLLRRADMALYEVKNAGRGGYRVHDPVKGAAVGDAGAGS